VPSGEAQIYPNLYRPGIEWRELKTPHFQIIFPAGEDSSAWQAGRILESQFDDVSAYLPGSELDDMPVILNNYNHRSNGFVTTLNFRIEAQMTPTKGKSISPRTGGWLENVLPHELVHAMHFDVTPKGNIFSLLKPFSPDGFRSLNAAAPAGILEGIAVEHETHGVTDDGGRGQYPYFTNQFESMFQSEDRLSLPQMTFLPTVSRPGVRHYMGGHEFIHWLEDTYGEDITIRAIERHFERPFLFFGHALKRSTGKKSDHLYKEYLKFKRDQLSKQSFPPAYSTLEIPFKGQRIRRPKWLNDNTLIFYGRFYNARSGFYRYHLDSGSIELIKAISITEDHRYHLDHHNRTITYGSYHADPLYDDVFKADLFETTLSNGKTRQLTKNKAIYAPVISEENVLAVQADGGTARAVYFKNGSIIPLQEINPPGQIIAILPRPHAPETLAIVMNRNGIQGLWLAERSKLSGALKKTPDIAFKNGSVYDPDWHPDGNRLMFSSDHTGRVNMYEYHLPTQQITQITNSPFNALEGSYNENGDRIVFIQQERHLQIPVILNRTDFYNKPVPRTQWQKPAFASHRIHQPLLGYAAQIDTTNWTMGRYRTGLGWLRPRAVLPIFRLEEEVNGLAFTGTDRLQRHTYYTEFTYGNGRAWYDLRYQYSGFFPGFEISVFNRVNDTVTLPVEGRPREFLLAEKGASLAIPIPITIKQNVYNRSFLFRPEIEYRKLDLRDEDNGNVIRNGFVESTKLELFSVLNWNTQQNLRDMQPNTGWSFFTDTDLDLLDKSTAASDLGYRFRLGTYRYFSPLRKLNQSLRLGMQYVRVRNQFVFDDHIIVDGFDTDPIEVLDDGLTFETRYLIPFKYPDNGSFGIPAFFDAIYLSLFTNTVFNLSANTSGIGDFFDASRTIYGFGIRARMKISNLSFDFGVGVAFEPTRNHVGGVNQF